MKTEYKHIYKLLLIVTRSYKGKSVNMSQIDVKHIIFEHEKNVYFSTHPPPTLIHLSHRFTSASNPQHRSRLTVVSATFAPPFQPLRH
jgi:hypothetical protein